MAEARFVEMQSQLLKAEEKLQKEEEKCLGLSAQLQELNVISQSSKSNMKAKAEQLDMLQVICCLLHLFILPISFPSALVLQRIVSCYGG